MDGEICRRCGVNCLLFKERSGKWTVLSGRAVEVRRGIVPSSSELLLWLWHAADGTWRYGSGDETVVPGNVFDGMEAPVDCEYYAEQLMEELNK